MADWLDGGRLAPPVRDAQEAEDLHRFAPDRFPPMSVAEAAAQAVEVYGSYYDLKNDACKVNA